MKVNRIGFPLAMFVTAVGSSWAASPAYVPNQILVKFRPTAAAFRSISHASIGSVVTGEITRLGVQTVTLSRGMTVDRALRYYKGLSTVEYAEPNYVVRAHYTPNDPRYAEQYAHAKLNMPQAWDLNLGDPKVTIAIVDSGVDYTHPDLSGKVILGHDFVNNDEDPMDDDGHGTHCAGIAAANTNNGIGGAGVGFNCSILAEKVLDSEGVGNAAWSAAAIVHAADHGAKVISLSLGGYGALKAQDDAVNYAWSKGAIVVASSGNDNVTMRSYPAAWDKAIAVGATDQKDARASFSNYGADWVDVAAPGVGILSTVPNGGYESWDGTSMACPVVSGLIGLMWSYSPSSTNAEIRAMLESTTDNVGSWVAKGRVNGFRAVSNLVTPVVKDFPAKSAAIFAEGGFAQGSNLRGVANNLAKVDNSMVSVDSVLQSGVGRVASLTAGLTVSQPSSSLRSATLQVAAKASSAVTLQFFAKNYSTGKYDLIQSAPGSATVKSYEVSFKDLGPYLSGTSMNIVLRGYISLTRPSANYTLAVDQANMRVVANPQ